MKILGGFLIAVAAIIIFYNVVIAAAENERIMNEHPWQTLFTGGANLKKRYTFKPPYTGFEVFVFALGLVGVVMLFIPQKSDD